MILVFAFAPARTALPESPGYLDGNKYGLRSPGTGMGLASFAPLEQTYFLVVCLPFLGQHSCLRWSLCLFPFPGARHNHAEFISRRPGYSTAETLACTSDQKESVADTSKNKGNMSNPI
jgi:hypothetical protein